LGLSGFAELSSPFQEVHSHSVRKPNALGDEWLRTACTFSQFQVVMGDVFKVFCLAEN
jgi:hypothetical protein